MMDGDLVDRIVKFTSQASGRDKLFRRSYHLKYARMSCWESPFSPAFIQTLVQYCSKFAWWYLTRANVADDLVDKLKKLSSSLSTARKFLRLGKSLDFLHSALRSLHISDDVLRWTITLSKLNQAMYLMFDHIVLAGRIGIAKVDGEKWNRLSAQFWIVTLILGITRDIYEIYIMLARDFRARNAKLAQLQHRNGERSNDRVHGLRRQNNELATSQVLWHCCLENKALILDLVKNLADLVLPFEALEYVKVSPGVQGLFGTVSSAVGVITAWDPLLRLVPS